MTHPKASGSPIEFRRLVEQVQNINEKPCSGCGETLPTAAFAPDARRANGLQSQCRSCQAAKYNSPEYKARRRRELGIVERPYFPWAETVRRADERRAKEAVEREERRIEQDLERALQEYERQKLLSVHEIGSPEWREIATQAQIDELDSAINIKLKRQCSSAPIEIALTGPLAVGPYERAIIDAEDRDLVSGVSWMAKRSNIHTYACRNTLVQGRPFTIRLHRMLLGMGAHIGIDVDHINGNTMDNRLSNLRPVTRSQNLKNTRYHREEGR